MNKFSIKTRLYILAFLGVISTLAILAFSLMHEYTSLLESRKIKTRHLVELGMSLVEHYASLAEVGQLTTADAQAAAISALKRIRYDEKEYFWVNDMHPIMIMHPMKPELDGKDLSSVADPNGKHLFVEFVKAVKTKEGAGFVNYMWPKGTENSPQPKISYVKAFKPWGWVIGSGIYIDDVKESIITYLYKIAGIVVPGLIAMMFVALKVTRSINKGISDLLAVFDTMLTFDFRTRPKIASTDEIGQAAKGLSTVLEGIALGVR